MLPLHFFFSYGTDTFDGENVISARYYLKNESMIKATIGSPESGVDINYGLEELFNAHAACRTILD